MHQICTCPILYHFVKYLKIVLKVINSNGFLSKSKEFIQSLCLNLFAMLSTYLVMAPSMSKSSKFCNFCYHFCIDFQFIFFFLYQRGKLKMLHKWKHIYCNFENHSAFLGGQTLFIFLQHFLKLSFENKFCPVYNHCILFTLASLLLFKILI